jgi:hypothetical protein
MALCLFGAALAWFHASEFALAVVYQRSTLSHRCEFVAAGRSDRKN